MAFGHECGGKEQNPKMRQQKSPRSNFRTCCKLKFGCFSRKHASADRDRTHPGTATMHCPVPGYPPRNFLSFYC
eukprot:2315096-Rhodomonas_salina.1